MGTMLPVPEQTSARNRDLAVAYRIYPGLSRQPLFSFDDKIALAELCLRSFVQALGGVRVKVWALLDHCPPVYEQLFRSLLAPEDLEIVSLPGLGNEATFVKQIELLSEQQEADLVYFAEDDYLYLPAALEKMVQFMQEARADFVTAYDHSDYYSLSFHHRSCQLLVAANHHWRSANSTCLTFMARRDVLRATRRLLATYARRNPDAAIWISLTKAQVFNPLSWWRAWRERPFLAASFALAWRHGWRQILFGRKRQLWAPVPSLATHLESTTVAPVIEWQHIGHSNLGNFAKDQGLKPSEE